MGLRARVTATFGIGALVLSTALAGITYTTARHYLLKEWTSSGLTQAFDNAALVRNALRSTSLNIPQFLVSLDTSPGYRSLLYYNHNWFSTSLAPGRAILPSALQRLVLNGKAATQNYSLNHTPQFAVGVPIPAVKAVYFEVFDMAELARTLQILTYSLLAAAAITTLAGIIVGRWASGRALRPLVGVSKAAASIASGNLSTRLSESDEAELSLLTKSFNQMADHLQERIEVQARFSSDVSHELRSPLTTLSTTLGVVETHRDIMPERSRQALDMLSMELRRFSKMVTDLLEISRFDTGSADVVLEEVRIDELVKQACAGNNLQVKTALQNQDLWIKVDKRRMERVIVNLVDNANIYGKGVRDITIEKTNNHIQIVVDDNGPGIPVEQRQRVFERFYRGVAKPAGKSDGVGLGLALVAEHIRLHNGQIYIKDVPGGGARFVIELPK